MAYLSQVTRINTGDIIIQGDNYIAPRNFQSCVSRPSANIFRQPDIINILGGFLDYIFRIIFGGIVYDNYFQESVVKVLERSK
ncbi:MAG: hypothetical protein V2B13_15220 [Pseudomonadota bacterium]